MSLQQTQEYDIILGGGYRDLVENVAPYLKAGWRVNGAPIWGAYDMYQSIVRDIPESLAD